jgi:Protein of unknown function (DUF938)
MRKMSDDRQYAPATLRNRDFILDVLRDVLPRTGAILEIASGSGEHIVHFVCLPLVTRGALNAEGTSMGRVTTIAVIGEYRLPRLLRLAQQTRLAHGGAKPTTIAALSGRRFSRVFRRPNLRRRR